MLQTLDGYRRIERTRGQLQREPVREAAGDTSNVRAVRALGPLLLGGELVTASTVAPVLVSQPAGERAIAAADIAHGSRLRNGVSEDFLR